jgi:hypothetical protein
MKYLFRSFILIWLLLVSLFNAHSQTESYLDYLPSTFEGSTVVENMYSPSLEGNLQANPSTQPVKVYLPPGYDNYSSNRYPVIYLLHGYLENYNTFYHLYGLLSRLNRLISEK